MNDFELTVPDLYVNLMALFLYIEERVLYTDEYIQY